MATIDVNQRFAEVNPIALKEWFVAQLVTLFRDFGTATKADEVTYIAGRVLSELKAAKKYDKLPVGFLGSGLKAILTGVYEVKKLSTQTILSTLFKEGNGMLPQGQNMNLEVRDRDYQRLYANAAQYGDPQAKGAVWSIRLSCSKESKRGLRFLERRLNGFWATAAILAGLDPDVLVTSSDEEFALLKQRLSSTVASLKRRYESEEARRMSHARR